MTRARLLAAAGIAALALSPLLESTPAQPNPFGRCPAIVMMQNTQQHYAPAAARQNQHMAQQQAHLLQQQQRQYEQMLKQQQHARAMQAKAQQAPKHVPPPKVHVPPPPRAQTHNLLKHTPPKVVHVQPKPITLTKTKVVTHHNILQPQHPHGHGPGKAKPPQVVRHTTVVQTKHTLHLPTMKLTIPGSQKTHVVHSKQVGQPHVKHAPALKPAAASHTKTHVTTKTAEHAKHVATHTPAHKSHTPPAKKTPAKETHTPAKPSSRTLVSINFNCVACHQSKSPQPRTAEHRPEPVLNKPIVKAPAPPPRRDLQMPVIVTRQPRGDLLLQPGLKPKPEVKPQPFLMAIRPPAPAIPSFIPPRPPLIMAIGQPAFGTSDPLASPFGNAYPSIMPMDKRVELAKLMRKEKPRTESPSSPEWNFTGDSVLLLSPLARKAERPAVRERATASQVNTPELARARIEFGDGELDRPAMPPLSASLLYLNPSQGLVIEDAELDGVALAQTSPRRPTADADLDLSRPALPALRDSLVLAP